MVIHGKFTDQCIDCLFGDHLLAEGVADAGSIPRVLGSIKF